MIRPIALCAALLTCTDCAPTDPQSVPRASSSATSSLAEEAPVVSSVASAEPSATPIPSEDTPDGRLAKALRDADPRAAEWMAHATDLRLQVLVTEVKPEGEPWPEYSYRAGAEYVYPASAIKPLLAAAALRVLNRRSKSTIEPTTRILRCAKNKPRCAPPKADEEEPDPHAPPPPPGADDKKKHKKLFLKEEIANLLSYSDNDAYDRLYDIVGHRELNEEMVALGFPDVRFQHRMSGLSSTQRETLAVRLVPPRSPSFLVKARKSDLDLAPTPATGLMIGASHVSEAGRLEERPMDFGSKNYASLRDLQRFLIALVRPDHAGATDLGLGEEQRKLLTIPMTRIPQSSGIADHNPLGPGILEALPLKRLRYIGKAGRAYGFLLESAYIEDTETHRAIFVAATVLSNDDGVMNDDKYDYAEIGRPILRAVGAAVGKMFFYDADAR